VIFPGIGEELFCVFYMEEVAEEELVAEDSLAGDYEGEGEGDRIIQL
jgi:hypothetical protein